MFKIKHRWTGAILFEAEAGSIKVALELAVQKKTPLRGADLRGADLRGADLRGAYLSGADLVDAGCDSRGYSFTAHWSDQDKAFVIVAGCRYFTLAEAKAHWKDRHKADKALHAEVQAKIALIEKVARARGWKMKGEKPDQYPVVVQARNLKAFRGMTLTGNDSREYEIIEVRNGPGSFKTVVLAGCKDEFVLGGKYLAIGLDESLDLYPIRVELPLAA